jgi:hypothetical protein
MFDYTKELLAAYVLPRSKLAQRPLPSWPVLLFDAVLYTLLMAFWHGMWLFGLVWSVHRYWWHALPTVGYLPAVAVSFFASMVLAGVFGSVTRAGAAPEPVSAERVDEPPRRS